MKKRMLLSTLTCSLIAAAAMAADVPGSTPVSSGKPPVAAVAVPRNASAAKVAVPHRYTVEDLYKKSAELAKKKVVVHGVAVKVTSGIMGKTWTHIQDGTGDKSKGTNDVICISAIQGPEVGEEISITGTVTLNPQSRYKLVLEDATFNK